VVQFQPVHRYTQGHFQWQLQEPIILDCKQFLQIWDTIQVEMSTIHSREHDCQQWYRHFALQYELEGVLDSFACKIVVNCAQKYTAKSQQ
jgi:hypothetical protein